MVAIRHGEEDRVRICLRQHPDLGLCSDFDGVRLTPLHLAAEWGWVSLIQPLLGGRADINASDSNGSTPLIGALGVRQLYFACMLIECGADVHRKNNVGKTALHIAARKNLPDAVKFLLEKGADPDAEDSVGETPLHEALKCDTRLRHPQDTRVVEELLRFGRQGKGADPCAGGMVALHTPLHMAAANNAVANLELLAAAAALRGALDTPAPNGAGDESLVSFSETALWLAAHNGHVDAVDVLLRHGATPSASCNHPEYPTPLWSALAGGHFEIAERLLATNAAAPDAPDAGGQRILHKYWRENQGRVVRLLLAHHAKPRVRDNSGTEPIHYALKAGDWATAGLLLDRSPDAVDALDGSGGTPLTQAAGARGSAELLLWLLSRGAKVEPPDGAASHALYCACLTGDVARVAALLGAAGGGVRELLERPTSSGNRPLHAAAKAGVIEVVRLLLAQGANKDAVSQNGYSGLSTGTPAEIARAAGHVEVAGILESWRTPFPRTQDTEADEGGGSTDEAINTRASGV